MVFCCCLPFFKTKSSSDSQTNLLALSFPSTDTSFPPQHHPCVLDTGFLLNGYRITNYMPQSSFHLAFHDHKQHCYLVKVLSSSPNPHPNSFPNKHLVALMKKFRHPNLLSLVDVIHHEEANRFYFVYEFADLHPLSTPADVSTCHVTSGTTSSLSWRLFREGVNILDFFVQQGFYFELKLNNCFKTLSNNLKVAWFGEPVPAYEDVSRDDDSAQNLLESQLKSIYSLSCLCSDIDSALSLSNSNNISLENIKENSWVTANQKFPFPELNYAVVSVTQHEIFNATVDFYSELGFSSEYVGDYSDLSFDSFAPNSSRIVPFLNINQSNFDFLSTVDFYSFSTLSLDSLEEESETSSSFMDVGRAF
ncbi:hypothetical protein P9112_008248 [Eukaryota sp. TZLM1-RC]